MMLKGEGGGGGSLMALILEWLEVSPLMLGHKNLAWVSQVLFHVAKQAPQWALTQEWAIAWDTTMITYSTKCLSLFAQSGASY